ASAPPIAASGGVASATGPEWVFCGHCGEQIGAEDVYCAHCGQRQPPTGSVAASDTGATVEPRVTAQLLVVSTGDMVKPFSYVINKESVLIGRTDPHTGIFPEIDLTMHDPE